MDVSAYLDRIDYRGSLDPTAETLHRLQLAHLYTVPFENLSIHYGQPIVLDDEALFEKIVLRRRGGFCYELNGLFAALLRELGFEVTMLSAGVMGSEREFSPEFDHMALLVSLSERWLVDVGFGDSFREPLQLDEGREQSQLEGEFRIERTGERRFIVMHRGREEQWAAQYRFDLTPRAYQDFGPRCLYHQTSPESHFTQKRVCSLATLRGRITLSEMRLITTDEGKRAERAMADQEDYLRTLREDFGITL